jgi:hypothetical protein
MEIRPPPVTPASRRLARRRPAFAVGAKARRPRESEAADALPILERELTPMFTGHKQASPASATILPKEASAMELQEALNIMRALAGGINPETGQAMEAESLCRKPQIVKALNRALGALVQLEQRERSRPGNAGKYWSREEDKQVCAEVRKGIDFHEIAKSHNRSVPSIVARLVKLGEIKPTGSAQQAA